MSTYVVRTLGCKANLYDSQLIEAELQKRGWRPHSNEAPEAAPPDLCIVNSCTVTDEADRQSRKLAARLGRENPRARVVVTGCGAEVDPERLSRSKGIHYVVGNQNKPALVELILAKLEETEEPPEEGQILGTVQGYEQMLSRHPMDREWPATQASFFAPPPGMEGHSRKTRAFLKIQEGCNSFCTYCVIPYGRGPSRSLRTEDLVAQARELVRQGVREIVLTGTNIGDYGSDWGESLTGLVLRLLGETDLERLRVSSLDPTEITPELTERMGREPRFCPHFHVSLQSVSSRILRLMKRKYGFEEVRECLLRISSSTVSTGRTPFVGMDLITGFPGETQEDFQQGVQALAGLPWSRLHVFPYSERAGTPAIRLPGRVPQEERIRRARLLNELSLARMEKHCREAVALCQEKGEALAGVLLERPFRGAPAGHGGEPGTEWWCAGYTPNYLKVAVPLPVSSESEAREFQNRLVDVRPSGCLMDAAAGEGLIVGRLSDQWPAAAGK